ncbi:MAG: class I SAM-dependent methyltransferase [bacterium]|nr:class I SAM-dependent methyltransferase [bacterium]
MSGGVLDASYAADRVRKPHIEFRYRVRARVAARAIERFLPAARRDGHVLELGCAEGRTLTELHSQLIESHLVGVEYSEDLLAVASTELPESIELLQGDAMRLPETLEAGGFDAVIALAVLEHLPRPLDAVREAARMLRPGGLFVATCPNPQWDRIAERIGLLSDDSHESDIDRSVLLELVRGAGLEFVRFERFMCAPVGFLPYLKIPIPAEAALRIDDVLRKLRVFDWLFVNQALVARKPQGRPRESG